MECSSQKEMIEWGSSEFKTLPATPISNYLVLCNQNPFPFQSELTIDRGPAGKYYCELCTAVSRLA